MDEFVWNDGGRASSGFVGLAGDCVVRSIAIATGLAYRDIYQSIGKLALKTPRNGVNVAVAERFLEEHGWQRTVPDISAFSSQFVPKGVVVAHVQKESRASGHFCTLIDQVVHDTWNPLDDEGYQVVCFWTNPVQQLTRSQESGLISMGTTAVQEDSEALTQAEFEKILRRLRALDNTANNSGSTEGEKHNALRMMHNLMLRHNLTRKDIVGDDNVDQVLFTRMACPVNGMKACVWEVMLAQYVTTTICSTVQWYRATLRNRTLFWFYGATQDVRNAIALFRELLLTIATSAQLRYGGYTRGSGASYAEGYVSGLPKNGGQFEQPETQTTASGALIENRMLVLHDAARKWLAMECDIRLATSQRAGRSQHDPRAAMRGREDGASHKIDLSGGTKRIGFNG